MTNQFDDELMYRQWYRFIADHCFTWKGILVRYNGIGEIKEILDSTRQFTVNVDNSKIEHYLCFINQQNPTNIVERRFIIEKCGPLIIHPLDPISRVMFSSFGSGVMSRPFQTETVNYAEIYFNTDNRRVSVVISYDQEYQTLEKISLFREVKKSTNDFPWSQDHQVILDRDYPELEILQTSLLSAETGEEQFLNNNFFYIGKENSLIFNFPDRLSINVPQTLKVEEENNLMLSWQYQPDKIKAAIVQLKNNNRLPNLITQDYVLKPQ